MTTNKVGSLINDRTPEITSRISELGRRFTGILPIILTHELLEYCETHPDDFVTAVGGGLERLGERAKSIEKAKDFVDSHLTEDVSLRQTAAHVGFSYFYFCKFFKKEVGVNFAEFVSRVRVEKAKNFLLNPHYKIGEIARGVGFKSLTRFNRVFKKLVGEAPTAYRRRVLLADPTTADIRTLADVG